MRENDERRMVDGETILERRAKVPPTIVGCRTKAGGWKGQKGRRVESGGIQGSSAKEEEEEEEAKK